MKDKLAFALARPVTAVCNLARAPANTLATAPPRHAVALCVALSGPLPQQRLALRAIPAPRCTTTAALSDAATRLDMCGRPSPRATTTALTAFAPPGLATRFLIGLTLAMSRGQQMAKPAVGRRLDGRVRSRVQRSGLRVRPTHVPSTSLDARQFARCRCARASSLLVPSTSSASD